MWCRLQDGLSASKSLLSCVAISGFRNLAEAHLKMLFWLPPIGNVTLACSDFSHTEAGNGGFPMCVETFRGRGRSQEL